jgi:hypothetical protein
LAQAFSMLRSLVKINVSFCVHIRFSYLPNSKSVIISDHISRPPFPIWASVLEFNRCPHLSVSVISLFPSWSRVSQHLPSYQFCQFATQKLQSCCVLVRPDTYSTYVHIVHYNYISLLSVVMSQDILKLFNQYSTFYILLFKNHDSRRTDLLPWSPHFSAFRIMCCNTVIHVGINGY